jgi:hypothetical protein
LEAVGVFENKTTYRELVAGFTTAMHDLRGIKEDKIFHADPQIAYPASQSLAGQLLSIGSNGVLYPSVRYPKGQCLAAFKPNIIQNIRQGSTWLFAWSGSADPIIQRVG